jgi:hypothetical protein
MKNFLAAVTAALVALALDATVPPAVAGHPICRGPWAQWGLIQPGVRFGQFRLGTDGAETLKKLTKPTAIDSGKSQTWQVWKWSEHEVLLVHTTSNGSLNPEPSPGVTIDLIRFSYPGQTTYKTWGNISTGSTLEEIQMKFPDAQPLANAPTVYDDVKQGIAFEFEKEPAAQSPCIAIMVHLPGRSEVATQGQVEELLKKGAIR